MYPAPWIRAKMFIIFKKGGRNNPDNYRGISVTDSIAKLYDIIISEHLYQWFRPCREQAEGQQKLGCLEHIAPNYRLGEKEKKEIICSLLDFLRPT